MHTQNRWGYIFISVFLVNIIVLFAFPFVYSLYLSFTDWNLFNKPDWVGLENWIDMLGSVAFWQAMRNIGFFTLLFVPVQTVVALIFAGLLNQQIRAKAFFQTVFFLPVVTPWIAAGVVWAWILNYHYGIVNWILGFADDINWLGSQKWWVVIGAVAMVSAWKGVGQIFILLLVGLQNTTKEMIESARIDGASGKDIFFRIELPLATPMIYLVLILGTIASFQQFDVFIAMFNIEFIPDYLNIPNVMVYKDAFRLFEAGPASVVSWCLFLIIMGITLIQRKFENRWVHYE